MTTTSRWTIADHAGAYREGTTVSSLIAAALARAREAPPGVFIGAPLQKSAMAEAARLDALDDTQRSILPLFGVPFLVKDNIDVAEVPTTAGCPGFAYTPGEDATIVALLRAAGAIPIGKTNLDQFATGLVGTRSPYGTPPNVIDPTLVPGGSSSGSAVAVALGIVPFALGTDTAGSGRVPAALNGIVGFKPTVGSCSTSGIVPAMRRIDCPSVFTLTVADAAIVGDVIAQADPLDPFSRSAVTRRWFRKPCIVGVPSAWPVRARPSAATLALFEFALERLRSLGCVLVPVDIDVLLETGAVLYGSSLIGERAAAVGDAVSKDVEGLDPVVASIIASGAEFTAVDAYRTEYELARLRAEAAEILAAVDCLALPTTLAAATLAEVDADPIGANEKMGRLTTFVNLLDLTAVVVPLHHADGGAAPAGLQLIGRAWTDHELIRIATEFETGAVLAPGLPCRVAVVGAHLTGLPLNHQLTSRNAVLVGATRTCPDYRLFALPGTVPPKPGMVRGAPRTGAPIDVEVWAMGEAEFATFVVGIPSPLCIGTVELEDGTSCQGFLCEPHGVVGATDITDHGGWKAYLAAVLAFAE